MPKFKKICVSTWEDIGHIPTAMRAAGFSWLYAVPQPISDSWSFYCCEIENLPGGKLPKWARSVGFSDASSSVGVGLSEEMADRCKEWVKENFAEISTMGLEGG